MKIGLLTWGSHGDIRPFLALADGLQADGHEVHLIVSSVQECGTLHSPHGARITMLAPPDISPEQAEEMGRTIAAIRNPMKQLAAVLRLVFAPSEDAIFAAAQRLCAESELVIGHYFMHPLQIAAEQAGLPYASVLLTHAGVPSAFSHPIQLPFAKRLGNKLLWWLTRVMIHRAVAPYANRLRQRVGLPPCGDTIGTVWLSSWLSLVAVSPQICARQPDWQDNIQVCGFLDMPNIAQEGELTDAIRDFLQAGSAPLYMTFGSWMPQDVAGQTSTLAMLSEAARAAGVRAIIQSVSADACGFRSDGQILYVSAAPHHRIFPHCMAVLHHGGAGTTQSATLAGKPSIVVANLSEQEHWGNELHRLGIAGKPLQRHTVTAARIAAQIRRIQAAPQMAQQAAAVGQAMRSENGVAAAVAAIKRQSGDKDF
jgi:UDP:flavonoid glycosyltransferase YjiC (YdhE family)